MSLHDLTGIKSLFHAYAPYLSLSLSLSCAPVFDVCVHTHACTRACKLMQRNLREWEWWLKEVRGWEREKEIPLHMVGDFILGKTFFWVCEFVCVWDVWKWVKSCMPCECVCVRVCVCVCVCVCANACARTFFHPRIIISRVCALRLIWRRALESDTLSEWGDIRRHNWHTWRRL